MNKTIRQLWDETKTHAILDARYQMLCVVMENKTRYTIEHAARVIPGFLDLTPFLAAEAIVRHHDAMKRREGENYWRELWDEQTRIFLGLPTSSPSRPNYRGRIF